MGLLDVAKTLAQVPTLLALKKGMAPRPLTDRDCVGALVERNAATWPDAPALLFEGRTVSWHDFNLLANRYAAALRAEGLSRGDTASVFMENRVEFLALLIALNKLGVIAGLINTNLRGRPLSHCVTVTASRKCIFGAELAPALAEVRAELEAVERELAGDVREKYERVVKHKGADGLAPLDGRSCGGCCQQVTSDMAAAVTLGRVVVCRSCGRLLYGPETSSS